MSTESRVNVYGSALGKVLTTARGAVLTDQEGRAHVDLFSSAGVANFGHNHPVLKRQLMAYLEADGLVHGLDYHTESKRRFIERMEQRLLPDAVRGRYRYYFSPPAGTLAMEAAIKYARRATGRRELAAFTNAFHGLTQNALSITGNLAKRRSAYADLPNVTRLFYDGYLGADFDYLTLYRKQFEDASGGAALPAALVFETIQAEGGCHHCTPAWYEGVLALCREFGIVSIVDEIQAGVGRTGEYFSFPALGHSWPDIICLSKSLSGMGLPLSLVMVRKELDVLDPGENSGTFRGNCLGVASAANAIDLFCDAEFQRRIAENRAELDSFCLQLQEDLGLQVRGRGLLRGMVMKSRDAACAVLDRCRERGILIEACGGDARTLKLMPPLPIETELLSQSLRTVRDVIRAG